MILRWERRAKTMTDKKLEERNIPGMNRNARFAEVEYA